MIDVRGKRSRVRHFMKAAIPFTPPPHPRSKLALPLFPLFLLAVALATVMILSPLDSPRVMAQQSSSSTDRAALVALYNATDGPNWRNNDNWLSDKPIGEWHGVTTDANGRVSSLVFNWFGNSLNGSMPSELGNLSELQRLDFTSNNKLSGAIPSELGKLSRLTHLNLYGNSLSGSIPSELGKLSKLTRLNLAGNRLSGSIPSELGKLSKLTVLSLGSNRRLSGSIPSELGNLSELQHLHLGYNQLSGTIPPELGNLSHLTFLALDQNRLSGTIPSELGSLTKLRTRLDLSYNQLSGSIPSELGNLSKLTYLELNNNQLSGSVPAELGKLFKLEWFYIQGNQLSGCIPFSEGLWRFVGSNQPLPRCEQAPYERPNQAPTVERLFRDITLVSESDMWRGSYLNNFRDADDDSLIVTAESSDEGVATAWAGWDFPYAVVIVKAQARGTATITVTADDLWGGTVSDTFTVTVKAKPVVASPLPNVAGMEVGATREVSLSGVFSDADGDALTVTAVSSSNENVATVTASSDGTKLTLTGVVEGRATITVTVQDGDSYYNNDGFNVFHGVGVVANEVSDSFEVKVGNLPENRAPAVSAAIGDATIVSQTGTRTVSLSGVFDDADNDSLIITAASSDDAKATASVSSDYATLTVNAQARGTVTVTVTADDSNGGTVEDAFTVRWHRTTPS